MKQKTWIEFIVENFKAGTVTEISKHIEKVAIAKNFHPSNKTIPATVQKILPEHTIGRFKSSSNRKLKQILFSYDIDAKTYSLIQSTLHVKKTLMLNKNKKVNLSKTAGEKISIETPKDKSIEHSRILALITDYAKSLNFDFEPEFDNIVDLIVVDDENKKVFINEVKSYSNSIYTAVGQLLFYKNHIRQRYNAFDYQFVLNIVGNFKLDSKYCNFLVENNINYFNYQTDLKKIF